MRMKNAQSVLVAVLTAGCVLAGTREASAEYQSNMVGAACYPITGDSPNSGAFNPGGDQVDSVFVSQWGINNQYELAQSFLCPLAVIGGTEIQSGEIVYYNRTSAEGTFTCTLTLLNTAGDILETIPFTSSTYSEYAQFWEFTPTAVSTNAYLTCSIPGGGGEWLTSISWGSY
jgi:hypothetical protein